jgi:hypothetical protein
MDAGELAVKLSQLDRGQLEFLVYYTHGWCPEAVEAALAAEARTHARTAEAKPSAHVCKCGHFEAYHVGAVLGADKPRQCTYDDECDCQRYRQAVSDEAAAVSA